MDTSTTEADAKITSEGYRVASLEAARMAEFVFAAKSDNAHAFVAELTALTIKHETEWSPRLRARQLDAAAKFRISLGAFAADLIFHYKNTASEGFMFRSVEKEAMGQTLVSVRSFEKARSLWENMGLLETTSFIRAKDSWEDGDPLRAYFGRTGRYRAKPSLLAVAARFHIEPSNLKEHFEKEADRIAVVQVRGEQISRNGARAQPVSIKKKGLQYEQAVSQVKEVNRYLSTSGFDLSDTPAVSRIYSRGHFPNFNFDQGGRLYCRSDDDWQGMPAVDRLKIRCNGGPVVELDIRASYMFILYALHPKFPVPQGDPYSIVNVDRNVVKGLVTVILGKGRAPSRWPKGFIAKYKLSKDGPYGKVEISDVLALLYGKHPVLHKVKIGSMDWGRLQYEESECFIEAILDLGRNHNITALPVHDSLIVAQRNAETTERAMLAAYQNRFGRTPDVKVSKADIS